uniref:Inositol-tetrakisphosphate 1-kinase n=1 Tax=Clytia hemisphaerica TaxID=252671 RepID=A0A7M5XH04_9CNID|eukprot:TCONS_00019604-protein
MTKSRIIRFAVMLPKDKARKIRIPERIESLCQQEGIEVTTIDAFKLKEDKIEANFDIVLHKIFDYFNEPELTVEQMQDVIQNCKDFFEQNPKMIVLDDTEKYRKCTDRLYCTRIMRECSLFVDGIQVFVPKSLEIAAGLPSDQVRDMLSEAKINFPILVKPMYTSDRKMSLVFSLDDVNEKCSPSLVQEFYNHNDVMYKVFVMNNRYNVIQRPSIKNYEKDPHQKPIFLDSRDVSKMGRGFHPEIHKSDPSKQTWQSSFSNPDILNKSVLNSLCVKLRDASGLKMFGFDLLVVRETGHYAIVDLNPFPGFKGIPDDVFADDFVQMLKDLVFSK